MSLENAASAKTSCNLWSKHLLHKQGATNFDLRTALTAIEQCGIFSVSHLLWQEPILYNGYLQRPVTLTPGTAAFINYMYINDLGLSRRRIELQSPACKANALVLSNRGGLYCFKIRFQKSTSGFKVVICWGIKLRVFIL